jgi:hypothetical protein
MTVAHRHRTDMDAARAAAHLAQDRKALAHQVAPRRAAVNAVEDLGFFWVRRGSMQTRI